MFQRKIQEFAERSENEFFVIDLLSEEPVPPNLPPRNSLEIAKRDKSIAWILNLVIEACLHAGKLIAFQFSPRRGGLSALLAPPPPATSRPSHRHYVSRAARKVGTREP